MSSLSARVDKALKSEEIEDSTGRLVTTTIAACETGQRVTRNRGAWAAQLKEKHVVLTEPLRAKLSEEIEKCLQPFKKAGPKSYQK